MTLTVARAAAPPAPRSWPRAPRLHARHWLDIGSADLGFALAACARRDATDLHERRAAATALETAWSPAGDALASLSVRSAFELYLATMAWPAGSEVLLSALNIPDMQRLLLAHELVPVPVDVDPATLAPDAAALAARVGPRTRAILVAHLFGGRLDLTPALRVARAHGLALIEDAAQAFTGVPGVGHPGADLSMVSFGSIKTATALGGALVRVRDPRVLAAMRARQAGWPVQPVARFARKATTFVALGRVQRPGAYAALARGCSLVGTDLDALLRATTRGFVADSPAALRTAVSLAPCTPLLRLLARRLERFDHRRLARRAAGGETLARAIGAARVLGGAQPVRSHWLFAVSAPIPDALVTTLRAAGFDATRGASTIAALPAPPGHPEAEPDACARAMRHAVFLPAYPELADDERARLAAIVHAALAAS